MSSQLSSKLLDALMTLFEHFVVSEMLHVYGALPATHIVDPGIIFTIYLPIAITVLKGRRAHYIL
jgi:hypothetical protein